MGINLCIFRVRELRESRQRFETLAHEVKRKDHQIKELQSRLESGEGCK